MAMYFACKAKGALVAGFKLKGDKHWQVLEPQEILRDSDLPLSTLHAASQHCCAELHLTVV